MKHLNDDGAMVISTDYFAADMIDRAISNYWTLKLSETLLMERFKEEVLLGEPSK
jgi:hypothetical protein